MQVLNAEASGDLRKRNPYIYSSPDDLRVADVESLLAAYKHLVRSLRFSLPHRGLGVQRV